ncbi:hypothetical protein F4604DRAFT_1049318 [Suillus subluteus]|nr:hypothetical protein F4604DRAFT_1049318 [Suillus subluteus]
MQGWTVQEFLTPKIVLFSQADWTLYLDDRSRNHRDSVAITQELERSTGINARALVAFRPVMRNAQEKPQWASTRVTTLQEDAVWDLRRPPSCNLRRKKTERARTSLTGDHGKKVGRNADVQFCARLLKTGSLSLDHGACPPVSNYSMLSDGHRPYELRTISVNFEAQGTTDGGITYDLKLRCKLATAVWLMEHSSRQACCTTEFLDVCSMLSKYLVIHECLQ